MAAEHSELVRGGAGTLFGAAAWVGGNEVAAPAFGLFKVPWEFPLATHASALASDILYGVTTELVRRGYFFISDHVCQAPRSDW